MKNRNISKYWCVLLRYFLTGSKKGKYDVIMYPISCVVVPKRIIKEYKEYREIIEVFRDYNDAKRFYKEYKALENE